MKDSLIKIACFIALALIVVAAIGGTVVCFKYNVLYGIANLILCAAAAPTVVKLFKTLIG